MHYHAEVWLPSKEDVEEQLAEILGPHQEGENGGWWDWYQVGGRWSGAHHTEYSPEKDPRNWERCGICKGTGIREDKACNGCHHHTEDGKLEQQVEGRRGWCVKWPTGWAPYDGDVIPVAEVADDLKSYTLVVPGEVLHQQIYEPGGGKMVDQDMGTVKQELAKRGITEGYMVTVDYHC